MELLEKINTEIKSLPTLPTIFDSISQALKDPLVTPDKLASIIASDQASVIKVLKVANSPFYGFRGKIDTISKAVFYLGFKEVQNLIFALSLMNIFSKDKVVDGFHPKEFWKHSIAVGIISRMMAEASGEKNLENYFLSGIIHDIGKLLFMEFAFDEYQEVSLLVDTKGISIKKAEFEVFGFDHTNAGKLLAEKWKLPITFINVIHYHHLGIAGNNPEKILSIVHIANVVARFLNLGSGGDPYVPEPNAKAWESFSLPASYFSAMRKRIDEDFHNATDSILGD